MFVALNIDAPEDVVDVVEDIFDNNEMNEEFVLEPIEIQDANYEAVEIEIQEIEMAEIEIEVMEMEAEVEAEIEMEIQEAVEEVIEVAENTQEEEVQEQEAETEEAEEEVAVETKPVEEKQESNQEKQSEDKEEIEKKPEKESSKEKAVKKIMKKMDDKKRYDDVNQTKTLVVMQVLGDSKTFFDTQQALNDRVDFFSNVTLPDTTISDNSMASYFLFAGSDGLMNELVDSQWQN